MDMTALAAAGITAALCGVVVRQKSPELAALLALAACVLLLWNTLPLMETIRDVLEELAALGDLSPVILRPMVQTVGLSLVTRLSSALCRDAGEGGIAAFLEVAGGAAAVVAALPLLKMVLQLVMDLL
ncbi:MAG: stage III sporulation AC/AD family protein [Ruminiclostridium sp.]|nr:stage III sporulation AC/AD family protein [Ruminiclostridium sp.]